MSPQPHRIRLLGPWSIDIQTDVVKIGRSFHSPRGLEACDQVQLGLHFPTDVVLSRIQLDGRELPCPALPGLFVHDIRDILEQGNSNTLRRLTIDLALRPWINQDLGTRFRPSQESPLLWDAWLDIFDASPR